MSEEEKKIEAPSIITREGHSVGKTEEFKRPDHTDFMTSSELQKAEFTGSRHNSLTDTIEIWVLGDLKLSKPYSWVRNNPDEWARLYGDTFGLKETKMDRR